MKRSTFIRVALAAMLGHRSSLADTPPFVIIIHPSNANVKLARKFVADAFLKKTTRWRNDDVIRPVDLVPDSNVREKFSQEVLKRSVSEVKSYWQQVIFSGRDVPPPELPDEDAVIKFVAKNAGAIGYVSGNAKLTDVRAVVLE